MNETHSRHEAVKQHEREFFISRVRAGYHTVITKDLKLKIFPPTMEDDCEINAAYHKAYCDALDAEVLTQEQMLELLRNQGLWTDEDDASEKSTKKDADYLRTEIFRARNDTKRLKQSRVYLRKAEQHLAKLNARKLYNQESTCEGIAAIAKSREFIKRCTFHNGELYNFEDISLGSVVNEYYSLLLPERITRDLARNDPWKSLWILSETKTFPLFQANGRELTIDQRNMLVWSKMYDNVHESTECPSEEVIADDDMLDGWFILQKQKREKDRMDAEFEANTNEKIKGAGEVFMMARNSQEADKVNTMNNTHGSVVKQQRIAIARKRGEVDAGQFPDEKLTMNQMSNEQFKGKFGG